MRRFRRPFRFLGGLFGKSRTDRGGNRPSRPSRRGQQAVKSQPSKRQLTNAGAALGMFSFSGGRDLDGFVGTQASTFVGDRRGRAQRSQSRVQKSAFKRASGCALEGDISSGEFDDIL